MAGCSANSGTGPRSMAALFLCSRSHAATGLMADYFCTRTYKQRVDGQTLTLWVSMSEWIRSPRLSLLATAAHSPLPHPASQPAAVTP